MTTGPMGRLKPGMTIDGEWLVEDMYRYNWRKIYILKHLISGIIRYMNHKDIRKLFTGERT